MCHNIDQRKPCFISTVVWHSSSLVIQKRFVSLFEWHELTVDPRVSGSKWVLHRLYKGEPQLFGHGSIADHIILSQIFGTFNYSPLNWFSFFTGQCDKNIFLFLIKLFKMCFKITKDDRFRVEFLVAFYMNRVWTVYDILYITYDWFYIRMIWKSKSYHGPGLWPIWWFVGHIIPVIGCLDQELNP